MIPQPVGRISAHAAPVAPTVFKSPPTTAHPPAQPNRISLRFRWDRTREVPGEEGGPTGELVPPHTSTLFSREVDEHKPAMPRGC